MKKFKHWINVPSKEVQQFAIDAGLQYLGFEQECVDENLSTHARIVMIDMLRSMGYSRMPLFKQINIDE